MAQLLFCWAHIGWEGIACVCHVQALAVSGSQVTLKWIGLLTGGWVKVLVCSMPLSAWHEWSVEMVGTSLQYSSKATHTDTSRNQACGDRPHLKLLNGNCCGLSCSLITCACSRLLARAQSFCAILFVDSVSVTFVLTQCCFCHIISSSLLSGSFKLPSTPKMPAESLSLL